MTNVDDLLQLGLIFFTSAAQLNRKKHLEGKKTKQKNTRQHQILCGERAKAVFQPAVGRFPSGLCYGFVFSLLKAMLSG